MTDDEFLKYHTMKRAIASMGGVLEGGDPPGYAEWRARTRAAGTPTVDPDLHRRARTAFGADEDDDA